MSRFTLHHGDSREILKTLAEASVDSIVCDPPYHLTTGKKGGSGEASVNLESPYGRSRIGTGFMGMTWDGGDVAHDVSLWAECLRVAKPGAWLLAFGGTRTYHRLACAIEDAGWELRDSILRGHVHQPEDCPWLMAWSFGSGFPKSHNGDWGGTALKPAWEPIVCARKPLIGTVEANWREHGTGALNIDSCRVDGPVENWPELRSYSRFDPGSAIKERTPVGPAPAGRWPANLIHDGSPEVVALFPQTESGEGAVKRASSADGYGNAGAAYGAESRAAGTPMVSYGDAGSAARFFASFPQEGSCPEQQSNAPTAAPSSSLQNALAVSVQSAAAIWPSLAGILSSDSTAPSTRVTPSESRTLYEIATAAMATLGSGCSREQRHEKRTPCGSLASVAATRAQTGTTTITASLSKSDGSVARATFTITPTNVDLGEAASRFRYCAKADRTDRNEGCEHFARKPLNWSSGTQNPGSFQAEGTDRTSPNHHPTVKPTDLMRYLCRLVTPKGGTVLDPFMGSGSTGKAAMLEGFNFIGVDLTAEYVEIARARIDFALRQGHQPSLLEAA